MIFPFYTSTSSSFSISASPLAYTLQLSCDHRFFNHCYMIGLDRHRCRFLFFYFYSYIPMDIVRAYTKQKRSSSPTQQSFEILLSSNSKFELKSQNRIISNHLEWDCEKKIIFGCELKGVFSPENHVGFSIVAPFGFCF